MSSDRTTTVWVLAVALLLAAPPAGAAPEFSGEKAFALLEAQCALGPRTPNSEAIENLRTLIEARAAAAGLTAVRLPFTVADPLGGADIAGANLVVSAGPAGGRRLWIGAHYDSRPVCDHDPDPARRQDPLPGANDGASGVAVLLHLMDLFAAEPPPVGVDLLFLDAEDSGLPAAPDTYCLGSRHLARTWRDFGSPLAEGEPRGLIILDMVGDRDLDIPMEQYSLVYAGPWTRSIFERAAKLGLGAFSMQPGRAVVDDHLPFLQQGIPAVDLIDFDYPAWHTTSDVPAACSAASLEQVGRLVADLVYRP